MPVFDGVPFEGRARDGAERRSCCQARSHFAAPLSWSTPCRLLVLAVAAAFLTGCASPIMRIEAPGYSVAQSPPPTRAPKDMSDAVAKLEFFRAVYYEAIVDRAQAQQNATTGLVWLGAAVVAMAAGTVHRDPILGATLIGGATYGLSRTQLDARHVQVWHQGIKALNCAKEAALPMDIGQKRSAGLEDAITQLSVQRATVERLRVQTAATAALVKPGGAALVKSAYALLSTVDEALIEADRSANAGAALLHQAKGAELGVAVDKIHAKVTEAMGDLLVDVSAVPQLIAGLGSFASAVAPGAPGVDVKALLSVVGGPKVDMDALLAAMKAQGFSEASSGGLEKINDMKKLEQQMDSLKSAMDFLRVDQQRVNGMLVTVDRAAVLAALKACGVAGVSTAMVLRPATLQFKAATADVKGFQISGGKAPYTVEMLDSPPEWLTPVFHGGLADTAQIKVTDKAVAGKSYSVLVSDSSPTKNSQILTVTIP